MTIHVNIGEAKTHFSRLAKAALEGEEVIISNAGSPKLRLVPIDEDAAKKARAARRRAAFGRFRGQMPAEALEMFLEPTVSEEEAATFAIFPDEAR